MTGNVRNRVFISYSRQDKIWLERLQVYLKPLERDQKLIVWDDTRIKPGENWRHAIGQALAQAKVAVMLVSPNFLASDFISTKEVPALVEAAKTDGVTILWVALSDSLYQTSPVAEFQAVNDPAQPLDTLSKAERGRVLTHIARLIIEAAEVPPKNPTSTATRANDSEKKDNPAEQKDQTGIRIDGNVNRGIIGGKFGDNTTINFGDK